MITSKENYRLISLMNRDMKKILGNKAQHYMWKE